MKKAMSWVVTLILVLMLVGTSSAGAEIPYKWTVYNGTREEWISLVPGEIIESKDLKNLLVGELRRDERVHWRWMNSMTEWVELEMGENIIQLDSYRHAYGWDVVEVQAMDIDGIYHPIGKFPVRFDAKGDFWMGDYGDCSIVSWGDGKIGVSVAYKYDIEVVTCSNVTLVTFEQVPAGNIVVSNIEEGDVIVIVGRDGDKRSLPVVYQVGEGDFALVNN